MLYHIFLPLVFWVSTFLLYVFSQDKWLFFTGTLLVISSKAVWAYYIALAFTNLNKIVEYIPTEKELRFRFYLWSAILVIVLPLPVFQLFP